VKICWKLSPQDIVTFRRYCYQEHSDLFDNFNKQEGLHSSHLVELAKRENVNRNVNSLKEIEINFLLNCSSQNNNTTNSKKIKLSPTKTNPQSSEVDVIVIGEATTSRISHNDPSKKHEREALFSKLIQLEINVSFIKYKYDIPLGQIRAFLVSPSLRHTDDLDLVSLFQGPLCEKGLAMLKDLHDHNNFKLWGI
jgi:hypothetical protein